MDNDQKPLLRISIRSPDLDVFRIDESYDIRKFIINKQKKFDVSNVNPSDFPKLFKKFQSICNCKIYANIVPLSLAITFWVCFIAFICDFVDYWLYPSLMQLIWWFLALAIFFTIVYCILLFIPWMAGHYYNKKELPILKALFLEMQSHGYIEKNLNQYPDSLQMAFWQYHWYNWHQDLDHYLMHWKSYYGFLSLKYFFWAYDNLKFPIDENLPWNCWFNRFVQMYAPNDNYIKRIFKNKKDN